MIISTLGFAFNVERTEVLLILKIWPEWQSGNYNGIGGKLEESDLTPQHGLVREFEEETGIVTGTRMWRNFSQLNGLDYKVFCFECATNSIYTFQKTEQEQPAIFPISELPKNRLPNLQWLIHLALDQQVVNNDANYL